MTEPCENCGTPVLVADIERDGVPAAPDGEAWIVFDAQPGMAVYEPHYGVDVARDSTTVVCCWAEHTPDRCRAAR